MSSADPPTICVSLAKLPHPSVPWPPQKQNGSGATLQGWQGSRQNNGECCVTACVTRPLPVPSLLRARRGEVGGCLGAGGPQGGPWAPEAVALLAFREGFEQSSQRTKPQTARPLCSEGVPRMCVSPNTNTSCQVGSRWPQSRVAPHCRRCAGAHWQGQRWDPALLPKSSHSGTHPHPAAACGQPLQVS